MSSLKLTFVWGAKKYCVHSMDCQPTFRKQNSMNCSEHSDYLPSTTNSNLIQGRLGLGPRKEQHKPAWDLIIDPLCSGPKRLKHFKHPPTSRQSLNLNLLSTRRLMTPPASSALLNATILVLAKTKARTHRSAEPAVGNQNGVLVVSWGKATLSSKSMERLI